MADTPAMQNLADYFQGGTDVPPPNTDDAVFQDFLRAQSQQQSKLAETGQLANNNVLPSEVQPSGQVAQVDASGLTPNPPASTPMQTPAPSPVAIDPLVAQMADAYDKDNGATTNMAQANHDPLVNQMADLYDKEQSDASASVGSKIENDLSKRADAVTNAPDFPNYMISSARLGVGGAADVAGDVLNDLPGAGAVKSAAGAVASGVGDIADKWGPEGGTVGDIANAASGAIDREEAASPTFANLMGAAKDYGNVAGLYGATSAVRGGINAASDAMTGGSGVKPLNIGIGISQHLDSEASKAYADATAAGVSRTNQAVQQFSNQAFGANADPANVNAFLNQAMSDSSLKKTLLNATGVGADRDFMGNPMTLETAQDLDQGLRTQQQKAFNQNAQGYDPDLGNQIKDVRQALRDNIFNNPDNATLSGNNPTGFQSLQEGNRLFSMARKSEDIENLIQNGLEKQVPSTAIQSQFSNLAKKIREAGNGQLGYSDDEVAAINHAAQSGIVTPILRGMGSRLITPLMMAGVGAMVEGTAGGVGGLMGGMAGELGGNVAGMPFRAAATALQKSRAEDVLQAIVKDPYYNKPTPIQMPPPATPTSQPMALLPSPENMRPIPMSDEKIAQSRAILRKSAGETGGVPITDESGTPPNGNMTTQVYPPQRFQPGVKGNLGGTALNALANMTPENAAQYLRNLQNSKSALQELANKSKSTKE